MLGPCNDRISKTDPPLPFWLLDVLKCLLMVFERQINDTCSGGYQMASISEVGERCNWSIRDATASFKWLPQCSAH